METGPFHRIFNEVTNKRIDLLADIIRTGNELSCTCATYLLSLIPTKHAAEVMLILIEEMDDDIGTMHDMASALIAHSPFRDELRPRLEKLFEKEVDEIAALYDETSEFDPRLLSMSDRALEIAMALEEEFIRQVNVRKTGEWIL